MTKKKLKTEFEPRNGYTQEDWDEVEAASTEATPEELAQARPFAEVFPELAAKMRQAASLAQEKAQPIPDDLRAKYAEELAPRKRGRPATGKAREQISIRLDPEVIEGFKASGPGWQGRMNDALRRELGLGEAS